MTKPANIYGRKWSEKEYLIVLNAYFEHQGKAQHAITPFVQQLSRILGRTPHSILYRLQNYTSIDPEETNPNRKGKVHITALGKRLFQEWSKKRASLREVAEAFLRDEAAQMEPDLFNPDPVRMPVTFRDYELLDEIGRGGFGIVFSCLNTRDDNVYAIKIIDGSRVQDNECTHRFYREIRTLTAVRHPNVIKIYEDNLEREKEYPGFVMDLAEMDLVRYLSLSKGKRKKQQRPALGVEESSKILLSLLSAVETLHESTPPIIHRDVNPNNILRMFDGTWVLADFSLAKFMPPAPVSTTFATATHAALGTAHYSAPEQYKNLKDANERADVFSLGWLLWELFSSEGPYPRREPSGLPEDLERIFLRATSHTTETRFASVREMKEAVEGCI